METYTFNPKQKKKSENLLPRVHCQKKYQGDIICNDPLKNVKLKKIEIY